MPDRLSCLATLFAFLWSLAAVSAAAQESQPPKAPPPAPAKPAPAKPPSPFEAVPTAEEQPAKPEPQQPKPAPGKPAFEAPPAAAEPAPPTAVENVIEAIEFRGTRRVPQDTLRALIFSKKGDKVDQEALHRDFMALWNTGRFDDIRLEIEPGRKGQIVRFVVVERQIVRSIK